MIESQLTSRDEQPAALKLAGLRLGSLAVGDDDVAIEPAPILFGVIGDAIETGATTSSPVSGGSAPLLPLGLALLIHLSVEVEGGELGVTRQRPELSERQLQRRLINRARLVDVDSDRARVAALGACGQRTPLGMNVRGVDVRPRGGSCTAPRHAAELLENAAPVDLVGDHLSKLLAHRATDRSPLTGAIGFLDGVLEDLTHLPLDELFLLVGHFSPAAVVIKAVAFALSLFLGFFILHDLGEVPFLRLVLGKACDELA